MSRTVNGDTSANAWTQECSTQRRLDTPTRALNSDPPYHPISCPSSVSGELNKLLVTVVTTPITVTTADVPALFPADLFPGWKEIYLSPPLVNTPR